MTRVNTFEEAAELAASWAADSFTQGTLAVLSSGQEDDWYFRVVLGAREWLADRDPLFAPTDETVYLVEKATGAVSAHGYAECEPFLRLMRPVGAGELFDHVTLDEARARAERRVEARLARRRKFKGK